MLFFERPASTGGASSFVLLFPSEGGPARRKPRSRSPALPFPPDSCSPPAAGLYRRCYGPRCPTTRHASPRPSLRKRCRTSSGYAVALSEWGELDPDDLQLFVSLTSFFNFHASTRTFSNSTETALTAWALAVWPWSLHAQAPSRASNRSNRDRLLGALALAALASLIRPSNTVIWFALGAQLFLRASWTGRRMILSVTVSIA